MEVLILKFVFVAQNDGPNLTGISIQIHLLILRNDLRSLGRSIRRNQHNGKKRLLLNNIPSSLLSWMLPRMQLSGRESGK